MTRFRSRVVFLLLIVLVTLAGCAAYPATEMVSFVFKSSRNASLSSDAIGAIDDATISVVVGPVSSLYLVPDFAYSGREIYVGEQEQKSGQSGQDFSQPIVYSIVGVDGAVRDYTVTVTMSGFDAPTVHTTEHLPTFGEGDDLFAFEMEPDGQLSLCHTADAGSTWTLVPVSWGDELLFPDVPSSACYVGSVVYALIHKEDHSIRLAASSDRGDTWTVRIVTAGEPDRLGPGTLLVTGTEINVIVVDNVDMMDYYEFLLFESTDGGVSWTSTRAGSSDVGGEVAIGRFGDTVIFAHTDSIDITSVWSSADGGETWIFSMRIDPWLQLGLSLRSAELAYLGLSRFYYVPPLEISLCESTDGGLTWNPKATLTDLNEVNAESAMTAFQDYQGDFYFFAWDNRIIIHRSEDQGGTWEKKLINPSYSSVRGLFLGGESETRLFFAGTDSTLGTVPRYIVSTDGGESWQ